tara:strand:+ start:784 stop:1464 length:681 start_codon:yes stop_codon:yes gene_type:complete
MRRWRQRDSDSEELPGCGFPLLAGCGVLSVAFVVCFGFIGLLHHQGRIAEPAVDAFSAQLAQHDYRGAYQGASPFLRSHQSEAEFVHWAGTLDRILGAVESRQLQSIGVHSAPNSHKVITIHYAAQFHGEPGTLIVTVDDIEEGDLRVRSWHVVAPSTGSILLGAGEGHEPKADLPRPKLNGPQAGASVAPIPSAAAATSPAASPAPSPAATPPRAAPEDEHHESQ